jgi:hypothetical protein
MYIYDLHLHHEEVMNMGMHCVNSVIFIFVHFAVSGQVEDLILFVNLKKPTLKSSCITQYLIYWDKVLNGGVDINIDSGEKDPFYIENLEDCVEYEWS